jgi:hypothetical protein
MMSSLIVSQQFLKNDPMNPLGPRFLHGQRLNGFCNFMVREGSTKMLEVLGLPLELFEIDRCFLWEHVPI